MNHPSNRQLHEYVDDALLLSERNSVHQHVRECAPCRRVVQSLQSLGTLIRQTSLETVSPTFAERVMFTVSQEPFFSFAWKPLTLFVLIFFVNAVFVYQQGNSSEIISPSQTNNLIQLVKNYVAVGTQIVTGFIEKYFSSVRESFFAHSWYIVVALLGAYLFDKFYLNALVRKKV
jgi:hypothetical protein